MNLASRAMLAHLSLALAEYRQTGGIHHDVRGTESRATRNVHCQRGRPTRHLGVVRHRQVQRAQTHQGFEKSFGRPVGLAEQGLERQAGLYDDIRAQPRLGSTYRRRWRPTLGDARLVKPDGQVAPIDQRTVVFRPVLHLVPVYLLRLDLVFLRCRSHLPSLHPSMYRQSVDDDIILRQRLTTLENRVECRSGIDD